MSAINTNQTYNTPQIAKTAIEKMKEAGNINEANRIGDVFLKSVQGNSTKEEEKIIAEFASKASKAMYMKSGMESIEKDTKLIAFQFLAEGVDGPVGKVLAEVACSTLDKIFSADNYNEYTFPQEAKTISDAYLEGIELHGTENEKLVAGTVRKSTLKENVIENNLIGYLECKFLGKETEKINTKFSHNIERMSLNMMAEGVEDQSAGSLIKNLASGAMKCDSRYNDRDRAKVAETFLSAVENTGSPEEKLIAGLGKKASKNAVCGQSFNTLSVAMNAISSGIEAPINSVIFDMIKNVDQYGASTMFEEFEKNTQDKNNAAIACAAGRMIGPESFIHRGWAVCLETGFGQSLAINMIEKGMDGTPEKNLMEFYKRVTSVEVDTDGNVAPQPNKKMDPWKYTKTMRFAKESILKAMEKYAENPENRAIAEKALKEAPFKTGLIASPDWKDNDKAVKIYDDAANKILFNIKEKEFKSEVS